MRFICAAVLLSALLAGSAVCDARDLHASITIRGRTMLPVGAIARLRAPGRGVYRLSKRVETRCVGDNCGGKSSKKTVTVRQSVR